MPQIQIYMDEKEDSIVSVLGEKWRLSKVDVIKRLIKDKEPEVLNL